MGIGESIKGTVKQKTGEALGDDQLEAEGDAQQSKGNEQARESKDRTEAKAHEKKADALAEEQQSLDS